MYRTSTFRHALSVLLCAIPVAAYAGDGQIEISDVTALAGAVSSGDAAGYPAELTESGSYILTSNLTVPADTVGILVTADNVTIDLNGFTIRGPIICSGYPALPTCPAGTGQGISSTAHGTVVRGGIVMGFADGGVDLGDLSSVHDLLAHDNGRVGIQVGDRGYVEEARVSGNDGDGIVAGTDAVVSGNHIVGNSGVGTVLGVGTASTRNVINQNGSVSTGGLVVSDNVCERDLSCTTLCTDVDLDGFFSDCLSLDCDDSEPLAFPGNPEICDGIDNDCSGVVDDGGACSFVCGNGLIEGPEACDDGNTSSCGTCDASCTALNSLVAATGTITTVAAASLNDGEFFTLNNGVNTTTTFEFDTSSNGVAGGAVAISVFGGENADQVRDTIITHVNSSPGLAISASPGGAALIVLANQSAGVAGNVPIFEAIGDPAFATTGMSGGTGVLCSAGTGCVTGGDCASGSCTASTCD